MPIPLPTQAPVAGRLTARHWTIGLVGLILGLVVGYGAGRITLGPGFGTKGSYDDGYNAAKTKLRESGILPANPTEARTLSGAVKSVGDDSFVMTTVWRQVNPLEPLEVPAERTVKVGADAKITRIEAKSAAEQRADQAAFQKALQDRKPNEPMPEMPLPYSKVELKLADLKPGDQVSVTADANILLAASFEAKEVSVTGAASPIAPAGGLAPAAPAIPAPATGSAAPISPVR